jgi:hypothetical protein
MAKREDLSWLSEKPETYKRGWIHGFYGSARDLSAALGRRGDSEFKRGFLLALATRRCTDASGGHFAKSEELIPEQQPPHREADDLRPVQNARDFRSDREPPDVELTIEPRRWIFKMIGSRARKWSAGNGFGESGFRVESRLGPHVVRALLADGLGVQQCGEFKQGNQKR